MLSFSVDYRRDVESLSRSLRARTGPAHARTELAVENAADLRTPEGRLFFFRLMRTATSFHAASLDAAAAHAGVEARTTALLRSLDADTGEPRPAAPAEPPRSLSQIAGIAYTLEGSSLGAAVLRRRIRPARSAYLDLLVTQRSRRWGAMCAWLDGLPHHLADDVVEAAYATFDHITATCAQLEPAS